jgi:hypothetical protein
LICQTRTLIPTSILAEHTKGAPACAGLPWGLAFETWDFPGKGQSSPLRVPGQIGVTKVTNTLTTHSFTQRVRTPKATGGIKLSQLDATSEGASRQRRLVMRALKLPLLRPTTETDRPKPSRDECLRPFADTLDSAVRDAAALRRRPLSDHSANRTWENNVVSGEFGE